MGSFFRKLRWLAGRKNKEAELQEELRFHLEEEAAERRELGLSPDEAKSAASRELGNLALLKEDTRTAWGWTMLEQLAQDVRYALRTMAANKTFTVLAVLSLALGIGANTAIFSFMDSVLMRSLPITHPETLVTLAWHMQRGQSRGMDRHDDSYKDPQGSGFTGGVFAYPAFDLLRKDNPAFSSVFGYQGAGTVSFSSKGQADVANGEYISGEYFNGLGVVPAAGRPIGGDDDRAGAAAVVVISYGWSSKHFGDPMNAIGQPVLVNNVPFTIVGVAPSEFFGTDPAATAPDLYLPMHTNVLIQAASNNLPAAPMYVDPDFDWVDIMARLRPGVSAVQAQKALAGEFEQWQRSVSAQRKRLEFATLVVSDGSAGLQGLRRTYSEPLYILLSLVGLILTIACANIANLLLARAAARKREMAVRLSMGAGRLRVIRQLLTESVLLAGLSGALGLAFAFWGIRFLTLLLASGEENFTLRAELNWHVLGAAALLSLLTGVLFGLAPALQSTRVDVMSALKDLRTGESHKGLLGRVGLGRVLIVAQVAITLIVLVATGLFVRTLSNLESVQLGFNRENLLTFQLNARQAGHNDPEIIPFYQDLQRRFAAIPGVQSATLSMVPLIGRGTSGFGVSVDGGEQKGSRILTVGSGFFSTMQIPILMGRALDERDRSGSPQVAVVSETFAKNNAGEGNPIGKRIRMSMLCLTCDVEIVGVSADARYGGLKGNISPVIFLPYAESLFGPVTYMFYELRTAGDPVGIIRDVRNVVHQADDRLPLSDVTTQSALIDKTINQQIIFARLCTAFGLLALAISCVGLYGTMSYKVARRTNEIGLRMALGAERGRVMWMVMREVVILVAAGLAISVPVSFAATKLIASFLFGVKPNDPAAIILAVCTVVIAAVVAGYLPARNASRIDPMIALRHE